MENTRLQGARYKKVFDKGFPFRCRLFASWSLAGAGCDGAAGVVASKKTFHRAVDRNRAKRLMREAYRLLAKERSAPAGVEWVFAARRAIAGRKCADVMEEMRWLFSRKSRRS